MWAQTMRTWALSGYSNLSVGKERRRRRREQMVTPPLSTYIMYIRLTHYDDLSRCRVRDRGGFERLVYTGVLE